jgi:hypothetical protein
MDDIIIVQPIKKITSSEVYSLIIIDGANTTHYWNGKIYDGWSRDCKLNECKLNN